MGRRSFTREFKHEAVKLVKDRGVSAAQVARDLGVWGLPIEGNARDILADAEQQEEVE
jgi:transposase